MIRKVFQTQLAASHDENGWFVSLLNSIDELNEEEANWKPTEESVSIH